MSAYETAIRNELTSWPGATVEFGKRSKHKQAVLHFDGRSRFVVYPDTPGDTIRGTLNCLADIRRELTTLGAVKRSRVTSAQRPRRLAGRTPPRAILTNIERAPVKPNPFDALAALIPTAPTAPAPTRWQKFRLWIARLSTPTLARQAPER